MRKLLTFALTALLLLSLLTGCIQVTSPAETQAPAASTPQASTPAASTPAATTPAATTPAATTPAASTPSSSYQGSAAFNKIFTDRGLEFVTGSYPGMQSTAFATVDSDGMITSLEFGYQGSTVKAIEMMMAVSVVGYTEQERTLLDTTMKEEFAEFAAVEHITVTYGIVEDYYYVAIRFDKFDNANVRASFAELFGFDDLETPTINEFRTMLISEGYVER